MVCGSMNVNQNIEWKLKVATSSRNTLVPVKNKTRTLEEQLNPNNKALSSIYHLDECHRTSNNHADWLISASIRAQTISLSIYKVQRGFELVIPGDEEVEHPEGHEGDADVEGDPHGPVLLKDLLQLLGLAGPVRLRLHPLRPSRGGGRRRGQGPLRMLLFLGERGERETDRENINILF